MSATSLKVHIHRNITEASVAALRDVRGRGQLIQVRGETIQELRNRLTRLDRPCERCLFLPSRLNDPFAALAETLWVLAGRNDVRWLELYLPRASSFSDDGKVWRAGYGPRLRRWNSGIDQLKSTRDLIARERSTRRAAMSLFDPATDFTQSKDIPCNNWLHWLVRDDKLHLNVALRSNDIMWGFSGVNCFEWSVLHELMARWCDVEVGEALYLASSFHLYERHFSRADEIIKDYRGISCYDFDLAPPPFTVTLEDLDASLGCWFQLEEEYRRDPDSPCQIADFISDPFLANALTVLRLQLGHKLRKWDDSRILKELSGLPPTDLSAAAAEVFTRKKEAMIPDLPVAFSRFLTAYRAGVPPGPSPDLTSGIKHLHAEKNAAYGPAWKKRGELTSILANVARKVDRLEEFKKSGALLESESVADTALDLFVYLTKYRLYLLEQKTAPERAWRARSTDTVLSDDLLCFNELVDETATRSPVCPPEQIVDKILFGFEELHGLASGASPASVAAKLDLATALAELAFSYYAHLGGIKPLVPSKTTH